jgi:P27 family predicted phage terminase small subunit
MAREDKTMAIRGRKPKPTRLKIISGTARKDRLNHNEPRPDATPPKCPAWLSKYAKREWRKLAPELSRLGLLTAVDRGCFAGYCSALAEFRAATETIEKEGHYLTVGGFFDEEAKEWRGGQMQPHPALAQQRTAMKAMRDFGTLFGLDPSSRARLDVPRPPTEDRGGLKAFIGGKKPKA